MRRYLISATCLCVAIGFAAGGDAQSRTVEPLTAADITAIATLLKLEDERTYDEEALVRILASPHPEVRRRATQNVGRIADRRGATLLRDKVSRRGLARGNLSWGSAGLDTGRRGYTLGVTPQPHDEGNFTALGHVVRGMDVVERLQLGDTITAARMLK